MQIEVNLRPNTGEVSLCPRLSHSINAALAPRNAARHEPSTPSRRWRNSWACREVSLTASYVMALSLHNASATDGSCHGVAFTHGWTPPEQRGATDGSHLHDACGNVSGELA
jgi:hypothetical protein